MNNKTVSFSLILTAALFTSPLLVSAATWTGPSSNPPNNNVSAPINVGSARQTKIGPIWSDGSTDPNSPSGFYTTGGGYFGAGLITSDLTKLSQNA
jgi:hypothetical protein